MPASAWENDWKRLRTSRRVYVSVPRWYLVWCWHRQRWGPGLWVAQGGPSEAPVATRAARGETIMTSSTAVPAVWYPGTPDSPPLWINVPRPPSRSRLVFTERYTVRLYYIPWPISKTTTTNLFIKPFLPFIKTTLQTSSDHVTRSYLHRLSCILTYFWKALRLHHMCFLRI